LYKYLTWYARYMHCKFYTSHVQCELFYRGFYSFMSLIIYKFFSCRPTVLKNRYRKFLYEFLNILFLEIVKAMFFLQIYY